MTAPASRIASVVDSAVQQAAGTVNDRVDKLAADYAELRGAVERMPETLGPNVIRGGPPSTAERAGFRFGAAVDLARGGDPNAHKYEADVSVRLRAAFERAGFAPADSRSVFVPLSADHIAAVDPALAAEVRQAAADGVAADPGRPRSPHAAG